MCKRFALIYLCCAAMLTLVLLMFARFDEHSREAQIATREARYVGVARERAEKDFESTQGDLRIIANMGDLRQYLDSGDARHLRKMQEYFLLLSRGRQHYDQIRYLDATGMEIIRVNYRNGVSTVVPRGQLQNKSAQHYFRDSMQLGRDDIYVSPLNLNVEHGEVEVPYRPVICFAIPVFDSAERRKGVVVLSYIADEMLQHFRDAMQGSQSKGGMLLNSEGYWLSSPNSQNEWGFMLDHPERTFGHVYPDAWATISKNESGTLMTEQGMFAYDTARPLLFDEHPTVEVKLGRKPDPHARYAAGYQWKIVSFVPASVIDAGAFYNKGSGRLLTLSAYLLLAVGIFFIGVVSLWRKKAEAALQEMALLSEMAPWPVMRIDHDGTIRLANSASKELYAMGKVEGMSIFSAIPGLSRDEFAEMFTPDPKIMQVETTLGEAHYFFVLRSDAMHQCVFAYGADISQIRLLEEQVRQAHKMEVVGQLAGGIAHDFNTLLGVILGYSEMLRDALSEDSLSRKNIDSILNAGRRAKALVKQLMDFSRLGTSKQEPVQLASLVKETIRLLRPSLPEKIAIQEDIRDKAGSVHGNAVQIGQVIINLCMNASDAMAEKDQGILRVGLKEVSVDDNMAVARKVLAGDYLQLDIEDDGCGMSNETMRHLFEPFFTTKEVGRGTGLGLAVVHGIVKSHGGFVTLESEPGKGTCFHVYLPRSRELWARRGAAAKA